VSAWVLPDDFESLTPAEARVLQKKLAALVREEEPTGQTRLVAGVDAAYDARGARTHAAAVVWELAERRVVEVATASRPTRIPYVPGFLAWCELAAVLAAWGRLERRADLVLVDGHGRAHPRRCGLACMLGLAIDLPTVGCAKTVLAGGFGALGLARGCSASLVDRDEVVGMALRTRTAVRPVHVSVGHRITLHAACTRVLEASRFRIPEPLRAAHQEARRLRAAASLVR
jgi:deoxyribonuclease V